MVNHEYTILQAISDLGGINPDKLKKCGTETEWRELPVALRLRIFRKKSTQGPDEIASQLSNFGIEYETDLLAYLKDPVKIGLSELQASDYDLLLVELNQVKGELERTKRELERFTHPYKTYFIQKGKNWIPVQIPLDLSDVPF